MVLFTVMKLIFPLRTRMPMWAAIAKVVTAPLHSPSFFHGYVGDIFTSMVKVFQDIAWTACWVASGDFMISEDLKKSTKHPWSQTLWYKNILIPIICLLPLVIRFNQCLRRYFDTGDRFPHLANALKYAMSQTVTLFGAFHPLYLLEHRHLVGQFNLFQIFWLILFVSSSLYSFSWDVYMDWGLGRRKYGFLGQSLMYPRRFYYYCVMALDLGTYGNSGVVCFWLYGPSYSSILTRVVSLVVCILTCCCFLTMHFHSSLYDTCYCQYYDSCGC
jgi:EXS family